MNRQHKSSTENRCTDNAGELRLLAAVALRAVDDFFGRKQESFAGRTNKFYQLRTRKARAEKYLFDIDDRNYIFNFSSVCKILGIDIREARAAILNQAQHTSRGNL